MSLLIVFINITLIVMIIIMKQEFNIFLSILKNQKVESKDENKNW